MSLVRVEERDGVAVIDARPSAGQRALPRTWSAGCAPSCAKRAERKGIVLTSANPRLFSAGWDLHAGLRHGPRAR